MFSPPPTPMQSPPLRGVLSVLWQSIHWFLSLVISKIISYIFIKFLSFCWQTVWFSSFLFCLGLSYFMIFLIFSCIYLFACLHYVHNTLVHSHHRNSNNTGDCRVRLSFVHILIPLLSIINKYFSILTFISIFLYIPENK